MNSEKNSILTELTNNIQNRYRESWFLKNQPDLHNEISNYCSLDIPFIRKIWHWLNDHPGEVLCKCGKVTSYDGSLANGYKSMCRKCTANDPETILRRKKTYLEKYGVENPQSLNLLKDKTAKTNKEKYGSHYSKTKEYSEKVKNTSIEKYGVDNYSKAEECRDKVKNTNLERYGVESTLSLKEVRDKGKETWIKKYGVDNPMKNKDVQNKTFATNLEKYGKVTPFKSESIKEKIRNTNIEKYGVDNYSKTEEFKIKLAESSKQKDDIFRSFNFKIAKDENYINYISNKVSLFRCDYGKDHTFNIHTTQYYNRKRYNIPLCTICNPIGDNKSIKEKLLLEYIESIYDGEIISGYRDGLEIDIYLPDMNIGFEFNGTYWHSEKLIGKNYHLDKKNFFKEKGIVVYYIWESDWDNKKDIIKSYINDILNINITVYNTYDDYLVNGDNTDIDKFISENSLYSENYSNNNYVSYYDNELLHVIKFSYINNEVFIHSIINKKYTKINNILDKFIDYIKENYNYESIILKVNNDIDNYDEYLKYGFSITNTIDPTIIHSYNECINYNSGYTILEYKSVI